MQEVQMNYFDKMFVSQIIRDDRRGGKQVANYFNSYLDLDSSFFLINTDDSVIPIEYKRIMLEDFTHTFSEHDQVKSIEMKFTDQSEVLIADETNYCDYDGSEFTRCHIYFSPNCSSNAAATSYFIVSSFSILCSIKQFIFSDLSRQKFAGCIMQRFGKSLTPNDKTKFLNEILDITRLKYIQEHPIQAIYTKCCDDKWTILDAFYDSVRKEVKLMYCRKVKKQICLAVFQQMTKTE
jgi:hypothetical protein